MQAWAEFEDTPGTVNGIKYSVEGQNLIIFTIFNILLF